MSANLESMQHDIVNRGSKPEVTVVCITYKHEEFIREALDSFLMQQTSFRFQIFVGEDKGPDTTADIVREYAARFPGVVVPFIRETNMGAQRNLIDMCQRAGTKYIAFCEGDDFWTDELKLQKQFDHMQANPELSGCFHNTEIQSDEDWYLTAFYQPDDEGRRLIPESIPRYDPDVRAMRMGYYIRFGPAHTSSMFFEWNYDLDIPEWYFGTIFGDHPIMVMQIGRGLLGFLPDVMSVYRRHAGGAIMSSSERDHHLATRGDWLIVLEGLAEHFRQNHGGFAVGDIEARMVTEMRNYLSHAVKADGHEDAIRAISEHPVAFEKMMADYTQTSTMRYRLIARMWGTKVAGLRSGALGEATALIPTQILLRRRAAAEKNRVVDYESFANSPKNPDLWLFMCDDKASYRDSVRSLYEYVVAHHPEVRVVWLTRNDGVKKLLQSEGLPVADLKRAGARALLAEAHVLFCESLRTDIFEMRGFNAGLRIVRLLDNRYHSKPGHIDPVSATETRSDEDVLVDGSTRDWKSASNLVVTESELLAQQLRAIPGVHRSRILKISTEPRLLAIPEALTPARGRHVLLSPGNLSDSEEREFATWFLGEADAIERTASTRNLIVHVHAPPPSRLHAQLRDRIDGLQHIEMLTTYDVHAHIRRLSGAVCGPDSLSYSLARLGIPVVMRLAADQVHHSSGLDRSRSKLLPGPTSTEWSEALATAVAAVHEQADPNLNRPQIHAEFGLTPSVDADALSVLFTSLRNWTRSGVAQ